MHNINRKIILGITCCICIISIFFYIIFLKYNIKFYKLDFENINNITQIEFLSKKNKYVLEDKNQIVKILEELNKKKTLRSSINDVPNNIKNYITVKIKRTNMEDEILYIYENKDEIYLEKPYNGIYKIDKEKFLMKGE